MHAAVIRGYCKEFGLISSGVRAEVLFSDFYVRR